MSLITWFCSRVPNGVCSLHYYLKNPKFWKILNSETSGIFRLFISWFEKAERKLILTFQWLKVLRYWLQLVNFFIYTVQLRSSSHTLYLKGGQFGLRCECKIHTRLRKSCMGKKFIFIYLLHDEKYSGCVELNKIYH